jgi:hypothetical protein
MICPLHLLFATTILGDFMLDLARKPPLSRDFPSKSPGQKMVVAKKCLAMFWYIKDPDVSHTHRP